MMLGINGRPVDPEFNVYALADRLGVLPQEIRAMPHSDLVHLAAYYTAKSAVEKMHAAHAAKRAAI